MEGIVWNRILSWMEDNIVWTYDNFYQTLFNAISKKEMIEQKSENSEIVIIDSIIGHEELKKLIIDELVVENNLELTYYEEYDEEVLFYRIDNTWLQNVLNNFDIQTLSSSLGNVTKDISSYSKDWKNHFVICQ